MRLNKEYCGKEESADGFIRGKIVATGVEIKRERRGWGG